MDVPIALEDDKGETECYNDSSTTCFSSDSSPCSDIDDSFSDVSTTVVSYNNNVTVLLSLLTVWT